MSPVNICLLAALVASASALRCYTYQSGSQQPGYNQMMGWQDCPPDAMYCYKTHNENKDQFNNKMYYETRSCANYNLCQEKGCHGGSDDRRCCCDEDLCNGASATPYAFTAIVSLAALLYHKLA